MDGVVDDLSLRDFVIGLVAVGLTITAVTGAARLMQVKFRPSLRELAQAWRIPWGAVSGTAGVMVALCSNCSRSRGAPSLLVAVPFDVGGDDARSAGRRTLALTYSTITPNSIVLGTVKRGEGVADPFETEVLLYLEVHPAPVTQMLKNLGARP